MDKTIRENRWLPPSPHKEEILKAIGSGKAYIQERGHAIPPLLVFEDGGVIELPRVRYKVAQSGKRLVAADDAVLTGQTKHPDVCGTLDELKGLLKDEHELAKCGLEYLYQLLDDTCYMISRMQRRRKKYEKFAKDLNSLCKCMKTVEGPEPEQAYAKAKQIRQFLKNSPESVGAHLERLYELAEFIRDVANKLEDCLDAYKDIAIQVGALYADIKGGRNWQEKSNKSS